MPGDPCGRWDWRSSWPCCCRYCRLRLFAGTDDPGPIAPAILAEGEPEPSADPTPPPPDPDPDTDPTATPDPTSAPDATPSPDPTATPDPTTAARSDGDTGARTDVRRPCPALPSPRRHPIRRPSPTWRPRIQRLRRTQQRPRDRRRRSSSPVRHRGRPSGRPTRRRRSNGLWHRTLTRSQRRSPRRPSQIDQDGICAAAEVVPTWTRDDPSSPLTVTDLAVDSCYRYAVELKLKRRDTVVERSGWFRVLKA